MLNLLASIPSDVVSSGRCNGVKLSSNPPAPSLPVLSRTRVKHDDQVFLGKKGTYLQTFGNHAIAKEPTKTLISSHRGFKLANHFVVEVESVISIKTATVCPRGGNEQRSVYVIGPLVPKNRVSPGAFRCRL